MSPAGTLINECRTYCAFTFPSGTRSVRLTARPAPETTFVGWRQAFIDWSPPCSGEALTCTIDLVASVAVKAAFSPVSLSVRPSGGGIGGGVVTFRDNRPFCESGESDCRRYDYDTTARLRADPRSGFAFSGWSGCTPSGQTCAVRMDANRIVTARFECLGPTCSLVLPITNPTKLKVQVVGHGRVLGSQLNCPVKCTRDVERGTLISIQARPDSGARFGGWITVAVTCSKDAERCTFPVFKDAKGDSPRLVALFKKAPPPPPPPPPKPPPPPPPSPPPPPQPVRCRVPKLHGLKLGPAKARIRSRKCSVGRVRRRASRSSLRGRVIGQRPRAGAVRRRGFPVKLVVGRPRA